MRVLPIRVRLTIWYTVAIAATLLSIGFVSLWMVHRAIDEVETSELRQRARSVERYIESRPPDESLTQLRSEITDAFRNSHGNKWLEVIDERANWIYRSPHVANVYPTLVLPQQLPPEERYFYYTAESLHVRALIKPITVRGVRYTVQTGLTLTEALVALSDFRVHLIVLLALGLLFASLGGHLMSRKALNPVATLAAEARRINECHLDIRLPVPEAKDELSDLSHTLNRMLERIDKAFASIRAFTGNASHELRTPISLMRAEIDVALYRSRTESEYEAILQRLHEETITMTSMLENLLSLARADGGAETVALAPISVTHLLRKVEQEWTKVMREAGLDFHVVTPKADLLALGEVLSIQRLLSILLENARKYTMEGSVTMCAEVREDRIVFSVIDTGIGIADEDRARIFERFVRVVATCHPTPSGSGLGLALAKWIAERHSTEIVVASELGRGSCFSFGLELMPASEKRLTELSQAPLKSNLVREQKFHPRKGPNAISF